MSEEFKDPALQLDRRSTDHIPPCNYLQELDTRILKKLEEVVDSQLVMLQKQESMQEVLVAWNNTKGFVKTVVTLSAVLKWIVGTGLAISAIWYFLIKNR